ncbi:MAG: RtcB family protein [Thermoplasmata archaeon]
MTWTGLLKKIDDYRFEIAREYKQGMRTSGLIYSSEKFIQTIKDDNALEQVANVATLPGIVGKSIAMPDIHWGYGFPIGGVAATNMDDGVISPGGVGYDINCGVRLLRTDLNVDDIKDKLTKVIDTMFENIPSGIGSKGKVRLDPSQLGNVLEGGAKWAVENGYGWEEDLPHLEENGCMNNADSSKVSNQAKKRGAPQLGTLGAGNHFLEIQKVEEIYDENIAKVYGITQKNQILVMIHTGSRGCGHQICTDYLEDMMRAVKKYNIQLPDRQLACAPINSNEGQNYLKAMTCAANYAWANRQLITHWVRESFEKTLGRKADEIGLKVVYDIAHNIAKIEEHEVDGKRQKLCVHRKGATRSFAAGHKDITEEYRSVGQPVLIPGDMGRASYVLVGTKLSMDESFGSTCHGAGRAMSRGAAIRKFSEKGVRAELQNKGIYIRAASRDVIAEEAPSAYKNVHEVVDITHNAGISLKVARLVPLGVVKG